MLGKTAGGLFWMFRNLERSENPARLLEAGCRTALTRSGGGRGRGDLSPFCCGLTPRLHQDV